MPLLNDASALYVGSQAVSRVYRGTSLVWQTGGGGPTPKTILMVVSNPSSPSGGDPSIISRLEGMGHTVILRADTDPEETSGFDAVFVSDSSSSSNVGTKYDTVAKPAMCTENMATPWRLGSGGSTGTATTTWTVNNVPPLNAGLTGAQTVLGSGYEQGMNASGVAPGGQIVAYQGTGTSIAQYVVYEQGATLTSGTAPARRVYFRVGNSVISTMTTTGWQLFDAAVNWMLS